MSRFFGPAELLDCYRRGVFPMANARDDPRLFLVDPDQRGVLPLDALHISRSLRKSVRRDVFDIRVNTAFSRVVALCAEATPERRETWINSPILNLYSSLNRMNVAHSIEAWRGDELVGGLYGVSLNGAFFGESMFSRERDASKVALVNLVARLCRGGFRLLDTQFLTAHLKSLGGIEIPRADFHRRLREALLVSASFPTGPIQGDEALQLITQTS